MNFRALSTIFAGVRREFVRASSQAMPRARYGGRQTVGVITGDGIGPEMTQHVMEVLRFMGSPIDFEVIELTKDSNESVLDQALLAIKRNGVAIKGNLESIIGSVSRNLYIRQQLGLFAYVMRCKNIPLIKTRHQNVDIFIVRENTEGEYSTLEHENVKGVVESLKIITREKSKQIAEYAFDLAVKNNRKKVTCVHKANIMKLGDGLFMECSKNVAKNYPDIEFETMIVDNCCMQIVSKPQQFDVMILPNLYGNILGNIGAGLVGGAGFISGMNIGKHFALFESGTRNSGATLVGKNIANPCAMLLAASDMLEYVGLKQDSKMIRNSILYVTGELGIRTPDLGGRNTTLDVVQAIIKRIHSLC